MMDVGTRRVAFLECKSNIHLRGTPHPYSKLELLEQRAQSNACISFVKS